MVTKLFSPPNDYLVPTELLDFDPDNPRFTSLRTKPSADTFDPFETICQAFGIRGLVASIVSGGYHGIEPMLVMPIGDRYVVLDGNRRLAAIRVILDREKHAQHYPQWLDEPCTASLERIVKVPVTVVRDRRDIWPSMAGRHGIGTMKWDNYGKASFFQQVSENYTLPDYRVANYIGVERKEFSDFITPYRLIAAAEEAGVWTRQQMDGTRVYYSRVLVALRDERIQRYIGIADLNEGDFAALRMENLGRLLSWLLGNKERGIQPVISDTEIDIPKLGRVVTCDEALQYLDKDGWLHQAYQIAITKKFTINEDLYKIQNKLWEMSASIPDEDIPYDAEGIAKQVKRAADELYERVLKKSRMPIIT